MHKQMTMHTVRATPDIAVVKTKLLDRYVLPKVAMVLILVSSAAGAWLTLRGVGAASPDLVIAKWAYFVALSTLLGGGLWGAFFARRRYAEQDIDATPEFLELEFDRFATIQRYAAGIMVAAGGYTLTQYILPFGSHYDTWYNWLAGALALLWLALAGVIAAGQRGLLNKGEGWLERRQRWLKASVGVALLGLLATAALDVVPYHGNDIGNILARWVHLSAFGVWFGGAVWNVFVAVPAARKSLGFETVFAAAAQLDQFRRVVRFALPLVVLTGIFQSYSLIGANLPALLTLPVGVLILAKVLLIVTLFGIFLACPMWRACSPIAGVCDITDIDPTPKAEPQSPPVARQA